MEDNSEYSFPTTWDETQTDAMKGWLAELWINLDGDEPEQDFLEYVMVMIKTQRIMKEIQAELAELGVDDALAKEFSNSIGARLKEVAANQKPAPEVKAEAKIVSMVSTSGADNKKVLGPLKTGRSTEPQATHSVKSNPPASGSSRLLQSALHSSRGSVQQGRGGQHFQRDDDRNNGQKRGYHDNSHQGDNKRFREQGGGFQDNRGQSQQGFQGPQGGRREVVLQPPRPGQLHAAPAAAAVTPLNETVQYFEQMNKVAQASGFRNAQEMLASQKEMMAMMQGGLPAAAPAPMPMFSAPFQMQTPFGAGPPPPPGYPPHHHQQQHQQQFGFNGFPGRGGRGFAQRSGLAAGRGWEGGRGGRGRGRFPGRGDGGEAGAIAPAAQAEGQAAQGSAEASSSPAAEGAPADGGAEEGMGAPTPAPTPVAQGEGGFFRGGCQGGYQGRGGRAFGGFGRGGGYQGRNYDPSFAQGGRFGRGGGFNYAGRGFNGGGRFSAGAGGGAATGDAAADASGAAPAGEGSAPTAHKTWVRKPDMNSALVTGR